MSPEIILPITIEEWFRSHRLDELKNYLDITEKYLQKAKADFEAWSDEQVKELPAEKRQEFYDLYYYDYWQYAEKFPRILRNSFLVSALTLLEDEMSRICRRLKERQQIPINLSDLRGNALEQAKLYFKCAKLNLKFNDKVWQEIQNYYLVRHCIVHNNSLIKGTKKERALHSYTSRKNIISSRPSWRGDKIEEVALTPQFCKEVVETIQVFLVELEKSINLKRK